MNCSRGAVFPLSTMPLLTLPRIACLSLYRFPTVPAQLLSASSIDFPEIFSNIAPRCSYICARFPACPRRAAFPSLSRVSTTPPRAALRYWQHSLTTPAEDQAVFVFLVYKDLEFSLQLRLLFSSTSTSIYSQLFEVNVFSLPPSNKLHSSYHKASIPTTKNNLLSPQGKIHCFVEAT